MLSFLSQKIIIYSFCSADCSASFEYLLACWISQNMKPLRSCSFFIVRNCSFFMGIIVCSSVTLVWTFNARGLYNFITKETNIPVNLILLFNDVSFLFCRFLKSGVTYELKSLFLWESKKSRLIYSKHGKNLLFIKR